MLELRGAEDALDISRLQITKSNPAYNAAIEANALYSANIVKAWVNVKNTLTPAVDTVDGFNVASVTFPDDTTMRITFTQAMTNTDYCVVGSMNGACFLYVSDAETTHVDVKWCYPVSGLDVDFTVQVRNHMVCVHGKE